MDKNGRIAYLIPVYSILKKEKRTKYWPKGKDFAWPEHST